MNFFYLTSHFIQLVSYAIKRVIFFIYRLLVFFTKPGAKIIVPIALVGATYFFRYDIDASPRMSQENWRIYNDLWGVLFAATGYERPLNQIALLPPSQTLMALALLSGLLLWLVALILRPIIGAFPIPAPPMRPRLFIPPKVEKLKAHRAKIVAPLMTQRTWDGSDKALIDLMEPELQQILTRDHSALDREIAQASIPASEAPIVEPSSRPSAPLRDDDVVRPD